MPAIPEVLEILKKIETIHRLKNEDYADQNAQFENFERGEQLISWFKHDQDKIFVGYIANKLARLATLLNKDGKPNNESIEDTFIDLATYAILWGAYRINNSPVIKIKE